MPNKVYTIASAKGGSGKTMLTATFAAFLIELKKKVLIIDSDFSTNGLTLMYLKEVSISKEIIISQSMSPIGLFDLSSNSNFDVQKFDLIELKNGVFFLPATYKFDNVSLPESKLFFKQLKGLIQNYKNEFDYIFIDAQAGSDYYASIAISKYISDEVIIVSEYDPLSAAGVERLKGLFREDLTYNRTWYLLNKMIPEFIQSFSDFLEIAKYLNPIPWDADVVRAYARRRLPLDLENGNEFTLALIQTIKTLLGEEIEKDIEEWKLKKEEIFKKPIAEQYLALFEKLKILNRKERTGKFRSNILILFLSSMVIFSTFAILILFGTENKTSVMLDKLLKLPWYFYFMPTVFGAFLMFLAQVMRNSYRSEKLESPESIEKEIIYEKLKKLESLKQSNFDEIVREQKSANKKI